MVEVKKATQSDYDYAKANAREVNCDMYPNSLTDDYAVTGWYNGKIFGVGGATIFWDGVAELWLIYTNYTSEFPKEALTALRATVDKLIEDRDLKRVQFTVRADYPVGIRFAEALGFHNETPNAMEKYLPDGTDAYLFSRIV
jgi:hypothetical protein